jgi:signal recognition particle subunit SRP54
LFDGLTSKLGGIFDRLKKRGSLSEVDVAAALREVRLALLEADVALPVVKDFITKVQEKAVGEAVLRSVTPGQQVIKIVHDELVALLGGAASEPLPAVAPPAIILMVGLQGSGKTTTSGKLAKRFIEKERKKVLLASLDTRRPAAQEQLEILAKQVGAGSLPIIAGQPPLEITARALGAAKLEGYDVLILDTAGRLAIDEELMAEVAAVKDKAQPHEVLFVADAMTGQDAVNVAKTFHERVTVTGIVLTRVDGDARGGAALSIRQVTGQPLKWLGTGEKMDGLEPFHPDRLAGRILGMGDVVSMVERAMETIDRDEAEKMAAKFEKGGAFTLDDMLSQMRQIKRMGGMSGLMNFLPGVGKIKDQLAKANVNEKMIDRQEAIILSMTRAERRDPDLIKARRKQRIAAGSGTEVSEVNKVLKQYEQMKDMMKQMQKLQKSGGLGSLLGKLPPGMMPPGGMMR